MAMSIACYALPNAPRSAVLVDFVTLERRE